MISSNCIQAIIHYSQSVDGAFCVHILFSSPDVHHRVIAIEPWDIFSVVYTPWELNIHTSQESGLELNFVTEHGGMTCLKCIFSHCALLLHELPEAVAKRTRNAIRLFLGYSTPRWTNSRFHSFHQ